MTSYHGGRVAVWGGDCLDLMAAMAPNSVDAIVTDPPYGLGFMGKKWDDLPPGKAWAEACYRVLKPGGHLLAFGGTRTWHRLAVAVEDGGFEIRDSLAWLYGSGFPKSMDVSKAIDKAAGAEREVLSEGKAVKRIIPGADQNKTGSWIKDNGREYVPTVTAAATPEAEQWQGWGTALKPAFEPIVVGRKPLPKGSTVAANVLAHGTGALNIDACRIGDGAESQGPRSGHEASSAARYTDSGAVNLAATPGPRGGSPEGRWPANVVLDESQAEALDEQTGVLTSGANPTRRSSDKFRDAYGEFKGQTECTPARGIDKGGASRFYYTAKASKAERPVVDGVAHPTVKPLAVMRWLVRLVTPPDGLVLDTFAGTGTTGEACVLEGFRCLMAEDPTKGEQDYLPLIDQRITRALLTLPATEDDETQEQTA